MEQETGYNVERMAKLVQNWKGAQTTAPVQPSLDKNLDYELGLEFALQDLYQVVPGPDDLTGEQRYRLLLTVPTLAIQADNGLEASRIAVTQLVSLIVSLEGQLQKAQGELWWHIRTKHGTEQ